MSEQPDPLRVARQWAEKAEHDLTIAQHALHLDQNCPYDMICFHAQQCTEKYLKALLSFHKVDFPKSHDVAELLALLPENSRLGLHPEELADLNPYAVEGRYPGEGESEDRNDAENAIEIALKVRSIIRKSLLPQLERPANILTFHQKSLGVKAAILTLVLYELIVLISVFTSRSSTAILGLIFGQLYAPMIGCAAYFIGWKISKHLRSALTTILLATGLTIVGYVLINTCYKKVHEMNFNRDYQKTQKSNMNYTAPPTK
jgi:HEPN domain-containing protein